VAVVVWLWVVVLICVRDNSLALFITVALHSRPLVLREPLLRWITVQSGEL
jgi:hypothetical protein